MATTSQTQADVRPEVATADEQHVWIHESKNSLERADASPDPMGGAHRFRVTASLAGRPFEAFVLDVGVQDAPGTGVELLTTPDLLGFAEIEPVTVPALPLAVQVAEKLHAYTRVYDGGRAGTRTKDLIDLALIAQRTFCLAVLDVLSHAGDAS